MLNFTPQEQKVFLFLLILSLIGSGTGFLSKKFVPVKRLLTSYQDIGKVALNEADMESLMGVKGIGEKLAQRIIEYRKNQHGFQNIEELKNIKGMSEYRYNKVKDYFIIRR